MRAFPLIAALLLTACQSVGVQTDFDPAANFTAYRTYQWLPSEAPRGMNPLMFRRVKDSIDRSLAARGYVQGEPADFAITFTIDERDRIHADDYGYGWGGWGYPAVDIYTTVQRSIVIDVYDAKTRAPVWHGTVKRESYSDRVNYGRLDQAVDAVLNKFPPQPGA